MDGVERALTLPPAADLNLFSAPPEVTAQFDTLPASLAEAKALAAASEFVRAALPAEIVDAYCL